MARDHHVELREFRLRTPQHGAARNDRTRVHHRGFCGDSADRVELLTPAVILVAGMAIPEQERAAVLAR